jgi:signal transduction histidine kinase
VAGVTIHADLEAARVRGNATLLAQAVANLVENAIRYNTPGGEVWVTLSAVPAGARLTIGNTGAHVTPETVARLVEPFHRGEATRTSGASPAGFGLGLAIVESVVTMHGGSLALIARGGGGLVATVDLPADAADDATTP